MRWRHSPSRPWSRPQRPSPTFSSSRWPSLGARPKARRCQFTRPGRAPGEPCHLRADRGGITMTLRIKRAYERPDPDDGKRILVDRLWPRGVKREAAAIDLWLKEIG